jgi:hypothetical protein
MGGRTYAENRPYLLPDTLGELAGPVSGAVQLPLRLDWSERAVFHLDDPAERNVMYERVIREAWARRTCQSSKTRCTHGRRRSAAASGKLRLRAEG